MLSLLLALMQLFTFYEKKTLWSFFMDGIQLPQGQNHFEGAV